MPIISVLTWTAKDRYYCIGLLRDLKTLMQLHVQRQRKRLLWRRPARYMYVQYSQIRCNTGTYSYDDILSGHPAQSSFAEYSAAANLPAYSLIGTMALWMQMHGKSASKHIPYHAIMIEKQNVRKQTSSPGCAARDINPMLYTKEPCLSASQGKFRW